jgi:hypothetical protein
VLHGMQRMARRSRSCRHELLQQCSFKPVNPRSCCRRLKIRLKQKVLLK